jgi:hypothetical protein
LRVIAADSSAAILTNQFAPVRVVALASCLVEPPYRFASASISKPIFAPPDGHKLIVGELQFCRELIQKHPASVIHVDMSLGGVNLADFTLSDLQQMSISSRAKDSIRVILPELRKIALGIERDFDVEVLAMGKDSMPVRIAELTAGANAVIYTAKKVLDERKEMLLGLPFKCCANLYEGGVALRSLESAEHDAFGYAEDKDSVMANVSINEFNNPVSRGFRVLKISLK